MRTHRVARTVAIIAILAALVYFVLGLASALVMARSGLGAGWSSGWRGWIVIPVVVSTVFNTAVLLLFGAVLLFLARVENNLALARKQQQEKSEQRAVPAVEVPVAPAVAGLAAATLAESEIRVPEVEVPVVEIEAPKVEVEAPAIAAALPELELPKVDIEAPKVELPVVELPKVDLEAPKIELPEVALPQVEVEAPAIAAAPPELELPKVDIEAPRIETALPKVEPAPVDEVAALRAELAALQARLAQLEAPAPAPQSSRLSARVALPEADLLEPEASQIEAGVSAKLPGSEEAARIAAEMAALAPPPFRAAPVEAAATPPKEDDLEAIEGIGPAYARRLRRLGITSFAALAEASDELLDEVAGKFAERVRREDWRGQARRLAE